MLDGVVGGGTGVVMMRDGTLRGGDSFYYYVGSYSCSSGRWKGEVTNQEHTQMFEVRPCPSSGNLRLIRLFAKGGSGSSGVRV